MSKCNPKQYRKRQILAAIETECGVPVELKASDCRCNVDVGQNADPDVTMIERNIAKASLSKSQSVVGAVKGGVTFTTEVVGSGSAAEPPCSVFLQGCGYNKIALRKIQMTWISEARPSRDDELSVTGGKARVALCDEDNLFVEIISGTLDSKTITGYGTAGVSTPWGFEYKPQSSSFKRLSIRSEEDGYRKQIYSAMGNMSLSVKSSEIAKMEFTFAGLLDVKDWTATITPATDALDADAVMTTANGTGVLLRGVAVGDTEVWYKVTSGYFNADDVVSVGAKNFTIVGAPMLAGFAPQAMTTGVSLPTTLPPTFQDAKIGFSGVSAVVSSLSVDLGNEISVREDANGRHGFISASLADRAPTLTVDPEVDESFDHWNYWMVHDVQFSFQTRIGSEAGNTCWIFAPQTHYDSVSDGDRDGVAIVNINYKLVGDDNELAFVFV